MLAATAEALRSMAFCPVSKASPLTFGDVATYYPSVQPVAALALNAQPQRRGEVLRLVVLANAHASPVRLGRVLGEYALHLVPALVVQHAQSKEYFVPRIARKKSRDKRSFIWVHESPQHVSVIIIG
jgi:hypothetical protein